MEPGGRGRGQIRRDRVQGAGRVSRGRVIEEQSGGVGGGGRHRQDIVGSAGLSQCHCLRVLLLRPVHFYEQTVGP